MSTDLEQQVRDEFSAAATPPGLTLDPDGMTQLASRAHRRRRAGRVAGAGMASLALVGTLAWAGGALPDPVESLLPASPWGTCPARLGGSGDTISLDIDRIDAVRVPVSTGGTAFAGVTEGCSFRIVTTGASAQSPQALEGRVVSSGGLDLGSASEGSGFRQFGRAAAGDTPVLTVVISPGGIRDVQLVGPGRVHTPGEDPVRIPGASADLAVIEGVSPEDAPMALVWRGADGLVRTDFGMRPQEVAPRAFTPATGPVDTWVAQDSSGGIWVMDRGEVTGPFDHDAAPLAIEVEATARDSRAWLVVVPSPEGTVAALDADGRRVGAPGVAMADNDQGLHAQLIVLDEPSDDIPLVWEPEEGDPQEVTLED